MGLRLIRQSSDEPNVSNTDDARMVRYAYGGEDGVVKNYGTELAATVNGSVLKIGSGCVVLHGWEVIIDANGQDVAVDNIATLHYYSVYLEINMATESYGIKSVYDTAGYPDVDVGDDLTAQATGTARLLLYRFTAQNGVIENVTAKFGAIEYLKTRIQAINEKIGELGVEMNTEMEKVNARIDECSREVGKAYKMIYGGSFFKETSVVISEGYISGYAFVEFYYGGWTRMAILPVHSRSNRPASVWVETNDISVNVTARTSSETDDITISVGDGTLSAITIFSLYSD